MCNWKLNVPRGTKGMSSETRESKEWNLHRNGRKHIEMSVVHGAGSRSGRRMVEGVRDRNREGGSEKIKGQTKTKTKPEMIHTNIPDGTCLISGLNRTEVVQRVGLF
tara:strand:- start:203 stop:523 length:321 start_codon:yes stop_codon:yes gene_type:complete